MPKTNNYDIRRDLLGSLVTSLLFVTHSRNLFAGLVRTYR